MEHNLPHERTQPQQKRQQQQWPGEERLPAERGWIRLRRDGHILRRLRQKRKHESRTQQRQNAAKNKYSLPAESRGQIRRHETDRARAEGCTREKHSDERGPQPPRRKLIDVGNSNRQRAGHADAGEESARHEWSERMTRCAEQSEYAEQQRRAQNCQAPSMTPRERAEQGGTDKTGHQRRAEQRPHRGTAHSPFRDDPGRREAGSGDVIAVGKSYQRAQGNDQEQRTAHRLPIEDLPEADSSIQALPSPEPHGSSTIGQSARLINKNKPG